MTTHVLDLCAHYNLHGDREENPIACSECFEMIVSFNIQSYRSTEIALMFYEFLRVFVTKIVFWLPIKSKYLAGNINNPGI